MLLQSHQNLPTRLQTRANTRNPASTRAFSDRQSINDASLTHRLQPLSPRSAMPPSVPPLQPKQQSSNSRSALPTNISITPVTPITLPAYRRLITLLLPIRYPDRFYKDSIANPTPSSLALCAVWHGTPATRKRKIESLDGNVCSAPAAAEPKVIAGIQCRIEPLPTPPTDSSPASSRSALYIQTLATLAPYRSLGVATALLDAIVATGIRHYSSPSGNVVEIYAHVWEANEDALEWYVKRGFQVEPGIIQGYYRKLRPSGARLVRRSLGVTDWLRVKEVQNGMASVVNGENGETDAPITKDLIANG